MGGNRAGIDAVPDIHIAVADDARRVSRAGNSTGIHAAVHQTGGSSGDAAGGGNIPGAGNRGSVGTAGNFRARVHIARNTADMISALHRDGSRGAAVDENTLVHTARESAHLKHLFLYRGEKAVADGQIHHLTGQGADEAMLVAQLAAQQIGFILHTDTADGMSGTIQNTGKCRDRIPCLVFQIDIRRQDVMAGGKLSAVFPMPDPGFQLPQIFRCAEPVWIPGRTGAAGEGKGIAGIPGSTGRQKQNQQKHNSCFQKFHVQKHPFLKNNGASRRWGYRFSAPDTTEAGLWCGLPGEWDRFFSPRDPGSCCVCRRPYGFPPHS